MTFTAWFSIFLVSILGAVSPGPSLAVVVKNSLGGDKINGIACSWAHAFGIFIYAVLTIFGLTIVLQKSPFLFNIITYSGALYLAYLGYLSLSSKGGISQKLQKGEKINYIQSAKEGILISILNPKIGLFFIALFSQFIDKNIDFSGKLITAMTPFLTDGLWYTFIVFVVSHSKVLDFLRNKANVIDKILGFVFIFIALRIVFH